TRGRSRPARWGRWPAPVSRRSRWRTTRTPRSRGPGSAAAAPPSPARSTCLPISPAAGEIRTMTRARERLPVFPLALFLVVPFLGRLIDMLCRPPEYLADVRERELEIKAMEKRLGARDLHCPVCRAEVEEEFLVCPVCTTRLRQACSTCGRPLEAAWQICP